MRDIVDGFGEWGEEGRSSDRKCEKEDRGGVVE